MGLQAPRGVALHLLPNGRNLGGVHTLGDKGATLQQLAHAFLVHGVVHHLLQFGANFRLIAVTDRLDEQLAQWRLLEQGAQYIKDLALQCPALGLQLT